jgi:hypothetical protein
MAAFSSSCAISELFPNPGFKEIIVITPKYTGASDTVEVPLPTYGISASGVLGITGWVHTTENCVITIEQPTIVISASGLLTITSAAGVGKKVYKIMGKSN